MENKTDFESCKLMIYKIAHNRYNSMKKAGRTDIELDEIIAQGMVIYCQCLNTYKANKSTKFTTYLYTNLTGRLRDYCRDILTPLNYYEDLNLVGKDGSESRFEDKIESPEKNDSLIMQFEDKLSYEALQVLKYIFSRKWECAAHKNKPTNMQICKYFGYSKELVDSVMQEIKNCWIHNSYQVA